MATMLQSEAIVSVRVCVCVCEENEKEGREGQHVRSYCLLSAYIPNIQFVVFKL